MPELEALYTTVDELRSSMGISPSQADDNAVEEALLVASRWADQQANQVKYGFTASSPGTVEVIPQASGRALLVLPEFLTDVTELTAVEMNDVVVPTSSYVVESRSVVRLRLGGVWVGRVVATGTWGWPWTPALVKRATNLYAAGFIAEGSDAEALTMRSISAAPEAQAAQFKAAASRYMAQAEKIMVDFRRVSIA